jgi:hypothetical protein
LYGSADPAIDKVPAVTPEGNVIKVLTAVAHGKSSAAYAAAEPGKPGTGAQRTSASERLSVQGK